MFSRFALIVLSVMTIILVVQPTSALGQDEEAQEGRITRLIRLRRLTTALEDYQLTPLNRRESVEVYRDDTSSISVRAEVTGLRMGSLLNTFADKHEGFDLSCIAVIRGMEGKNIEFHDGSDGLSSLNTVRLLPGDLVVIMSPDENDD